MALGCIGIVFWGFALLVVLLTVLLATEEVETGPAVLTMLGSCLGLAESILLVVMS